MANDPQDMGEDLLNKISKIVDVPFTEKLLQDLEKDDNIKVIEVTFKPATNKGDNYTSDMFRAKVDYNQREDEEVVNKTMSLIVKIIPLTEGAHQDFMAKSIFFSTEITMMTDTLAQMNEILDTNSHPLNSRCFYTQLENPALLIMEDLAPLGFRMADRQAGLDMDHCLLAIRNLAKFHASSVALFEREPDLKSKYINSGLFADCHPPEMQDYFEQGLKQLAKEIESWPEIDPQIPEKILKLADKIWEKGSEISRYQENEFNVLNHGDFWVNNMLFKYNESNRPISHIFVDFQLCLYSSPAIDLNYFFNTSLTDDTLMLNEETLINEYTRTLASTMTQTNCKTMPPSVEQVKDMIRERALYGMIAASLILPVMLVDKEEIGDLNELMETHENPGYKGKLYRKAMSRRLPKFDQMGLLD